MQLFQQLGGSEKRGCKYFSDPVFRMRDDGGRKMGQKFSITSHPKHGINGTFS
jgi:hypothetical protein